MGTWWHFIFEFILLSLSFKNAVRRQKFVFSITAGNQTDSFTFLP
jgi:hypothetical protein